MSISSLAAIAKAGLLVSALHHGYAVQPGDTLSAIAASHGVSLAAVEQANPQITNPDLIYAGQVIELPGGGQAATVASSPASTTPARTVAASTAQVSAASGSFQQCVISRESGGNPRAVNASSGAGGLYQFLPSTWHALGYSGLPENAAVSVQNAAFAKAYALWGTSPWALYDGC